MRDIHRYEFKHTSTYPPPGHKVLVLISQPDDVPLEEWQISYHKYVDEGIASMNFREFVMTTKIERRDEGKAIEKNYLDEIFEGSAVGRRPNGRFPFNESCDLFISHEIVLRSIYRIPIYASGLIPSYPGRVRHASEVLTSGLKKDQDEWALYMLCTFDVCNIDGIPKSLIRSFLLGDRVDNQYHLETGRPVYLQNTYTYHRPWKAIINFLKSLHVPSNSAASDIPFINNSYLLLMKNMAFTMKTVPKSRRKRVTGFRNRNCDKWVHGDKICSRYGVGWGKKGGWSGEDINPNSLGQVEGYHDYNNQGNVNEDDDDNANNTDLEQAAQAIADFQSLTDAQVYNFYIKFFNSNQTLTFHYYLLQFS